MEFGYKIVSNHQKSVNDFIHFKLIISNIIETKQLPSHKISLINRLLLNGVLIPNFLNNSLGSVFLISYDVFLP